MSKSLGFSYTDTAFGSPATLNLVRANTNYLADWAKKTDTSGEVIIVNGNSSVDRPENIRIAYTVVPDIYKGSGIDPALVAPSRKGFSLVVQITEVARITESADGSYVDLPLSAHLVIKAPANELITATVIETMVKRLLSSLYNDNAVTLTRLGQLMRGVVVPPEV